MALMVLEGSGDSKRRDQRVGARGASSLKVTDAFWYALLAFLVTGSTWGYTSDDIWYLIGTALGVILGAVSILSKKYSGRELGLSCGMIVLSIIVALSSHSLTLLLTSVLVVSSKEMRLDAILRAFLVVKAASLISLIVFGLLGLVDVEAVSHYSALAGGTIVRQSVNGVATNILHLGLFTLFVLLAALKQERLGFVSYLAMMAVNIVFYRCVSYSSAGILVTGCAILLAMGVRYSGVVASALCRFGCFVVPLTVAFFLYTGYQFDGTGWIAELNHLMTGRIAYNHYWLTAIGPTLFGVNPAGAPAAFDNSVVYLTVGLGVFAAMAVLAGYFLAMRRLGRSRDVYLLLAVFMFYAFSMSESVLPSAVVNPSLFIVVAAISPGFYKSLEETTRMKTVETQPLAVPNN